MSATARAKKPRRAPTRASSAPKRSNRATRAGGSVAATATVFAPATVANVAVGFDILGFAVEGAGDRVTAIREDEPGVRIGAITGAVTNLPSNPAKNTATAGLVKLLEDVRPNFGLRIEIEKGIALGSGMGGSAASAVGAIVAANALLPKPLSRDRLLEYALIGEAVASGSRHGDNVVPCLLGGLQLIRALDPALDIVALPTPPKVHCVLVHPHLQVNTAEARRILKSELALKLHVAQSANLAGFLAGCYSKDLKLLGRSLTDLVVEPQRSRLIPGFDAAKSAALSAGALGFSISGSGPSVFAWVDSSATGARVEKSILKAFAGAGLECDSWVSPISRKGAHIVSGGRR